MKTLLCLFAWFSVFTVFSQKNYSGIDAYGTYKKTWALVQLDDKYGFIDHDGNEVVKPIYHRILPFDAYRPGWALIILDDRLGFIDSTGKEVVKPRYEWIGEFGASHRSWAVV